MKGTVKCQANNMLTDELQIARELAIHAGGILLEHYGRQGAVEWKGVRDPVTIADKSASKFIVEELKLRFPTDGILCEEETDDNSRLARRRAWIIDPMDGTTEFIANLGEFAVMIGLAIEGKPVLGVVYQPTEKKLYHAVAGLGAYVEQEKITTPLKVSGEVEPSRMVIAVSRSHDSPDAKRIRERLKIEKIIRSGSAGLKAGMICEGKAHLYFHLGAGTNQWDTCAPQAILQEAGGRMTDIAGNPLIYNTSERRNLHGIIASNAIIHERVLEAARAVLAEK